MSIRRLVIPGVPFEAIVINFRISTTVKVLFVIFQESSRLASNWQELPAVVDGAVLNVVCDVPISAYDVGLSVFDAVIDVSVVVPGAVDVISDGSASIKGDFQASGMYVTIVNNNH